MEVPVSEVTPIVVDPNSEYYGRTGEMVAHDWLESGDCYIKFEGEDIAIRLNDGLSTGIPQFIGLMKVDHEEIDSLVTALPNLRERIAGLFSMIVNPNQYPPTPQTVAASLGFTALIKEVAEISSTSIIDVGNTSFPLTSMPFRV